MPPLRSFVLPLRTEATVPKPTDGAGLGDVVLRPSGSRGDDSDPPPASLRAARLRAATVCFAAAITDFSTFSRHLYLL